MKENLKIDFLEKITLSPIEKYKLYNKFPYKFTLHLGLVIFTTL